MASIEYGIDGNGRKVSAIDARKGCSYKCYYCKEDIVVREGKKRGKYFAHSRISNRTPQQMICECYKGNGAGNGYIDNDEDRIYIFNGGVPLHLLEKHPGQYELIAMFPPLSSTTMKLIEENGEVCVTNDGREQKFSVWNFRKYRVKSSSPWIYVSPYNFRVFNDEIKRKWFWGFRGLDFDNDFFRMDSDGGIRIGQLSSVVIGKEYLFVHRCGDISSGKGLHFKKKGKLSISDSITRREYDVYSVIITEMTDYAIAYVQRKGYQLIDKSDDLIPMWPPASVEGKELIYHNDDYEAFIYHHKESNQQVFSWGKSIPNKITEKNDILKCSTVNTTLLLSDYSFNTQAKEIRFILTRERKNFSRKRKFEYKAKLLMDDGRELALSKDIFEESFIKPIILDTNYKTTVLSLDENYVVRSTSNRIDNLPKRNIMFFLYEPYGMEKFILELKENDVSIVEKEFTFDYDKLIKKLYHCHSVMITPNNILDRWIDHAKSNSNDLFKILFRWKNQGKMPIKANKILEDMEELIR